MIDRKHRDTFSEPRQASGAGLLAKSARVVAMASVLAVTPMITGFPQISLQAHPHPVASHTRRVGFAASSVAAMRADKNASRSAVNPDLPGAPDPITTARAAEVTPVQDVAGPVTVVGVTWPKGALTAGGQFQIRTLSGATWSTWASLGVIDGGPDRALATTGTDPYVVSGASKYQVRSLTTEAKVPAAATVQAVDPGTSSADSAQQTPGGASAATTVPFIFTRAQWGADESKMAWTPSYGQITVGFVHHTVSANNYAASDVPAMIRGIYAYHAQTLGWGDIGYNFLVDRFGRIWEGRFGGMDKPVIGGHTLGYNSVGMGVSAIGNFDVAAAPQGMVDAFKRIFAWKFDLSGIPATGTVVANGKTIQRITGHRDVYQTACPGQYLYARIPEIRSGTAAILVTYYDATRDPFGQIDSTGTVPGAVTAKGWAIDPSTSAPILVQMYLDGHTNAVTWANLARPDVGRAYPKAGPNHGYTLTMQTTPGLHTVCLYAINTGPGTNRGLGCRAVTVVSGDPFGHLDVVTTSAGKVTARGWAIDPNTRAPILVQMYVDSAAHALTLATTARPDVARAYPAAGPNHGYTLTMPTTPGPHTVCLYAINTGPGTSRGIGCRATTVP